MSKHQPSTTFVSEQNKTNMNEYLADLSIRINREANFEDIIIDRIKNRGYERAEFAFEAYTKFYKAVRTDLINEDEIYNKYFGSNSINIIDDSQDEEKVHFDNKLKNENNTKKSNEDLVEAITDFAENKNPLKSMRNIAILMAVVLIILIFTTDFVQFIFGENAVTSFLRDSFAEGFKIIVYVSIIPLAIWLFNSFDSK